MVATTLSLRKITPTKDLGSEFALTIIIYGKSMAKLLQCEICNVWLKQAELEILT